MGGNSFGRLFRVVTFGESHGPSCGCVIDGCPAGLSIDIEDIRRDLRRRRPGGASAISSSRSEEDEPEILSGLFEGKTLGTPIAILIRNRDQRSSDYDELRDVYRPGHADWTWEAKYGFRDHRGGGRSSARETVSRVAAGAVARVFLRTYNIDIRAWTSVAAGLKFPGPGENGFDWDEIEKNPLRIPNRQGAEEAFKKLEILKNEGDSAGCKISCIVTGLPAGLGEPIFDKLDANLAAAMLSLGAAKGVEFGRGEFAGFMAAESTGSAHNDSPLKSPAGIKSGAQDSPAFSSNNCGGVLGGISNSMPLEFTVAFKPVPSIAKKQTTCGRDGGIREIAVKGRFDTCIAGRAVPVVEAMTALVLADFMLLSRTANVW